MCNTVRYMSVSLLVVVYGKDKAYLYIYGESRNKYKPEISTKKSKESRRLKMRFLTTQRASCEDVLHPLEDAHQAPQEAIHTCVEESSLFGACATNAVAGTFRVEEVVCLLAECAFERDGERNGKTREADGEAGSAADVEVGEVVEGALHFEEVRELVV